MSTTFSITFWMLMLKTLMPLETRLRRVFLWYNAAMKLGKYRHYSGGMYEVLGVVLHTETREKLVLYKALYPVTDRTDLDEEFGENPLFARPKKMFEDEVEYEGRKIKRFEWVGG